MEHSSAPLEGIAVIVVDAPSETPRIEKALSQAGAAVFIADGVEACRAILEKIQPHFAVIDPEEAGGRGPQSAAWMLFGHPEIRTIVYSSAPQSGLDGKPLWLIFKDRPVADVVDAVLARVRDPDWLKKGGDDMRPPL
ncbi:hypothetical protein ACQKKX_04560 [Neorhizobium sp. NPDC001467]|uniref:hypothetical protein n=1 Tax=Neorhizobium sp. NPDC001467 TaxID=3390595 RepID=UPI003D08E76B